MFTFLVYQQSKITRFGDGTLQMHNKGVIISYSQWLNLCKFISQHRISRTKSGGIGSDCVQYYRLDIQYSNNGQS